VAGLVVFLGTVTQSPSGFAYDAATYWAGSVSLAHGRDAYVDGMLSLRGVLTSVLYLPAALAARVFGDSAGGVAVLIENSLLVALAGALLLPWVLRIWGPVTPWMVWFCSGLTWLLVGRFAPYPLTDLWAAAAILAAVAALQRRSPLAMMGAGLFAGIAFNIRPAYLAPLVLTLAVVLVRQGLVGLWCAVGVILALVPQLILNLTHGFGPSLWPHGMSGLMALRLGTSSHVVRYDTVIDGSAPDPRQLFCDPAMAQAILDHPSLSTGGLVSSYLGNLPHSLVVAAERASAALHWPLSTPYFAPTGAADQMFALLVTTVAVLGVVSLVHAQVGSGSRSSVLPVWAALAVWLGSLASVVTSPPETRFGLPLVLIGIAGCAVLVRGRLSSRWVAGAVIAVVVVFAIGTLGLSHPAAPGLASASTCAAR
jgi:hypothetical protein